MRHGPQRDRDLHVSTRIVIVYIRYAKSISITISIIKIEIKIGLALPLENCNFNLKSQNLIQILLQIVQVSAGAGPLFAAGAFIPIKSRRSSILSRESEFSSPTQSVRVRGGLKGGDLGAHERRVVSEFITLSQRSCRSHRL